MVGMLRAALLLIVLGVVVFGAALYLVARRGLSTRTEPSRIEALLARTVRRLAVPGDVKARPNPVPKTPEAIRSGLEHFADHCAMCHANDGSGEVAIGRSLYPKAPDMRAQPTQSLSDGEIFAIIENGIRLTGMPAWGTGTAEGERESWHLVHFIRHLPAITPGEIADMEALNPRSPAEYREDEETRRFLEGEDARRPRNRTGSRTIEDRVGSSSTDVSAHRAWPRRTFVKGLAIGGAAAGLAAWHVDAWGQTAEGPQRRDRASGLSGPGALHGTEFDLRIGETPVNFTGAPRRAFTVNGSLPAPTLRWREGDTVTLRVSNALA